MAIRHTYHDIRLTIGFIRHTLSWIGVHVLGDKYLPPILKDSRKRSVKEVLKLNVRVGELRAKLYDEVSFRLLPVELLLMLITVV